MSRPLAVVVVTHLGGPLLRRCLQALVEQRVEGDHLLVVVSALPGEADLAGLPEEVSLCELGENPGFAAAANAGFAATAPLDVLLLNDDTRPLPGLLTVFRSSLLEACIAQPRILLDQEPDRIDNTGHGLLPDGFNWARGREDRDGPRYDEEAEVGACSGAAMWISREILDVLGGFDESLGAFGEDVDLCLRARRRGYPLRYLPQGKITHVLGASFGRFSSRKLYLVERNRIRVAFRSMPLSALGTWPLWAGLRWTGLGLASLGGRSWGARLPRRALGAAVAGALVGWLWVPDALSKRSRDAPHWTVGELAMWRHLIRHRVRLEDVLR